MSKIFKRSETFECIVRMCYKRFLSSDNKTVFPKRVPWHKKEGEWKSKLTTFQPEEGKGLGPDLISFFRGPLSFKLWLANMKEAHDDYHQRYIEERHDILGSDLATAHFIVHRGGSVKFVNHPEWIKKDEKGEYGLPNKYVPNLYLEAIDASNTELRYVGLQNFVNLKLLKWLSLSNCPYIDDWCLDKISGELRTLEYLDISDCKQVTYRGLSAFYRFENLKHLKVNNIASTREFEFMCLLLEDIFPNLVIEGVTYINVQSP